MSHTDKRNYFHKKRAFREYSVPSKILRNPTKKFSKGQELEENSRVTRI